jgi:hypothetical protein
MRKLALMIALTGFSTAALAQQAAPETAMPRVSQECRGEIQNLCPKGGDPKARHECLISNRSKISSDCQAQFQAHREAMKARRAMRKTGPATPAAQ